MKFKFYWEDKDRYIAPCLADSSTRAREGPELKFSNNLQRMLEVKSDARVVVYSRNGEEAMSSTDQVPWVTW